MDVDEAPHVWSRPELAPRTSSKRRLDDEDGPVTPADKRPRAKGVLSPDVIARLASLQSVFDSHALALDRTHGWDDGAKRVLRINAAAQSLLGAARTLADETAADLSEIAALDLARAERQPGVDPTPNLKQRLALVDACQTRIRNAQMSSTTAVNELRAAMGSPWTAEEETHWSWLAALRHQDDLLQSTLLSLLLVGFA